jgi:hypothetical protein
MNEIDRRSLLQATAALIVTFSLVPGPARAQSGAVAKTVSPDRVDGFLAIDANGAITIYSGKVDLGTGVRTALTQIVADELDAPMSQVTARSITIYGSKTYSRSAGPTGIRSCRRRLHRPNERNDCKRFTDTRSRIDPMDLVARWSSLPNVLFFWWVPAGERCARARLPLRRKLTKPCRRRPTCGCVG